ncbi:hypothetical protein CRG98_001839 [Punica granatum]|uniref:Uncharacterized protein n=1 Tax=Punica granatum TaxID=22663 RepID=A0A2I0LAU4_PUNGR|nr:hypothetical protein CRG98_001839 [Punica granatum]
MGVGGGSPTGELTLGGGHRRIIATHDDDELLHDSCCLIRFVHHVEGIHPSQLGASEGRQGRAHRLERCHPSPEIPSIMDPVLGICGSLLRVAVTWPKRFAVALKELDPSQVANCPSRWYICFSPFTASRSIGVYGGSSSLRAVTNLSGHGATTWSRLPRIPSSRSMIDGVSREEWHLFRAT